MNYFTSSNTESIITNIISNFLYDIICLIVIFIGCLIFKKLILNSYKQIKGNIISLLDFYLQSCSNYIDKGSYDNAKVLPNINKPNDIIEKLIYQFIIRSLDVDNFIKNNNIVINNIKAYDSSEKVFNDLSKCMNEISHLNRNAIDYKNIKDNLIKAKIQKSKSDKNWADLFGR